MLRKKDSIPFEKLSRENQLKSLIDPKNHSKVYTGAEEGKERDWVGLKPLTGHNASAWKFQGSFYGNFNVGRRPSIDTAWGRRIYDQYEIEIDKPQLKNKKDEKFSIGKSLRRVESKEFGIWDVVFSSDILECIECTKSWKANHEDRDKMIKKFNIDDKESFFKEAYNDPIVTKDDPIPLKEIKLKYSSSGAYLKDSDLDYCINKTNFSRVEVICWFKRFRRDCPNGRLTKDDIRGLFRKVTSSSSNAEEFIMAMDIATHPESPSIPENKYYWTFKLYDIDRDGHLDIDELKEVFEILDNMNGIKPGSLIFDSNENPEIVLSPTERARNLFDLWNTDYQSFISFPDFMKICSEKEALETKQDAQEQTRKLDVLIFRGHPLIKSRFENGNSLGPLIYTLENRLQIDVHRSDISFITRLDNDSVMVRFNTKEKRSTVYLQRRLAKKEGILIEEWLTDYRLQLYQKCIHLKKCGYLREVVTKNGDIIVWIRPDTGTTSMNKDQKKYEKWVIRREKDLQALFLQMKYNEELS
ncbi:NCS1 [Lepeophtheirus salmonis]|uniref:NCS1 n=1 Tax=Lepeophtheirus salmonis TaxID=72036 RepID=A0A7R8CVY3_LEPSM|nr:NCS1 [Lepeophtheirus salmonis]CAF2948866.1 NCS1 [Lepeophtheirus salmonis]